MIGLLSKWCSLHLNKKFDVMYPSRLMMETLKVA